MASFAGALREKLVAGKSCQTKLGLFYLHELPGYDGRNPRTGQPIHVAPKRLVCLLVSDGLSAEVLKSDFRTEAEERDLAREIDGLPIPDGGEEVECNQAYAEVVDGLAQNDRFVLPHVGEFVVRRFVDSKERVITFRPSNELRDALNPKADRR